MSNIIGALIIAWAMCECTATLSEVYLKSKGWNWCIPRETEIKEDSLCSPENFFESHVGEKPGAKGTV